VGPSSSRVGKKRLTAVDWTISSSNPSNSVILSSIHCVRMGRLIDSTLSFSLKFVGNLTEANRLCKARLSVTEAVPLMEGIVL
jgi:hypothetical protein